MDSGRDVPGVSPLAVERLADPVEARLSAILEDYGRFLRGAISRLLPRDLGIEIGDVEQEARIRIWQALRREREITNVASYLHRVAATATIDAVRRIKARREEPLESDPDPPDAGRAALPVSTAPSPESLAHGREVSRQIEEAVSRLEASRGRVVRLYLQGFAIEEIGDLMGFSEPKARNLIYRGLADLRRALLEQGIDYEAV